MIRGVRHTILLAAALLCGAGASAQSGIATALMTADAQRITVGDQARVFLTVQHDPANSRIAWTAVPDSIGKLEVVEKGRIDTIKEGRFLTYRQRLLVTGFDSGEYQIPPFQFTVTPASGAPFTIGTGSINMLVQTVPVDTTKPFKAIKGIMVVEGSWLDYIWWIVGGLLALVALGLVLYFTRQKAHVIPPPPAPPEPLHLRAIRMLEALEREGLWQKGEVKEYYVRLTDILRGYIEARFGVPAMERTTDELAGAARRHVDIALHAEKLYGILATADMAKFARAQPVPAEHFAAMKATKDFIMATVPAPQQAEGSGNPTIQHSDVPPARP